MGLGTGPTSVDSSVSTLVRLVDDCLAVSTRRSDAAGFVAAMRRGYPDYGCSSNPAKTRVSWPRSTGGDGDCDDLDLDLDGDGDGAVQLDAGAAPAAAAPAAAPGQGRTAGRGGGLAYDGFGRGYFPWCGSLFAVANGEVCADLRRRGKMHAAEVRNLGPGLGGRMAGAHGASPPLGALLGRMSGALKPKLHRLYLDPQLNSAEAVRRSLFVGLMHAAAFGLACARRLGARNAASVVAALCELLRFASQTARSTQRACLALPPAAMGGCSALVEPAEVAWLGWAAVEALLWHRRSAPLARAVWRRARALRRAAEETCTPPRAAVDARGLVRHFVASGGE